MSFSSSCLLLFFSHFLWRHGNVLLCTSCDPGGVTFGVMEFWWSMGERHDIFFFFKRKKKKILFLTFNSNITCFIKVVFEESVKKRKRTRIKANCFGDRVQVEFMLLLQKTCLIVERAWSSPPLLHCFDGKSLKIFFFFWEEVKSKDFRCILLGKRK